MSNVILVGFMGTGKSAVGELLAQRLNFTFLDLDSVIQEGAGLSVAQIFQKEGESGFRKREAEAVENLSNLTNHVISTGGGVVLNPENLSKLKSLGKLICLKARPDLILNRIQAADSSRPLLDGVESIDRIKQLLQERAPFYAQAHWTVDTSDRSLDEVAGKIFKLLKENSEST